MRPTYLARLVRTGMRVARMLTYEDEDFDEGRLAATPRTRSATARRTSSTRRTSRTARGAGSRTSSSECPTARTSPSTRSSPARRSRSTSSSSASTPSSSSGSRAAARALPRRARLRRAGDAADARLHRLLPPARASGC
jgi:hypothetical protein